MDQQEQKTSTNPSQEEAITKPTEVKETSISKSSPKKPKTKKL